MHQCVISILLLQLAEVELISKSLFGDGANDRFHYG